MKIGDKLRCNKTMTNYFGWELFTEGKIYDVLHIGRGDVTLNNISCENVTLNHVLYANEYADFPMEYINANFTNIKEERKEKLKALNRIK